MKRQRLAVLGMFGALYACLIFLAVVLAALHSLPWWSQATLLIVVSVQTGALASIALRAIR